MRADDRWYAGGQWGSLKSGKRQTTMISLRQSLILFSALAVAGAGIAAAADSAPRATPVAAANGTSGKFAGPKANTGHVTYAKQGMNHVLTLSSDFRVPDTPDPHWQVVDSRGTTYLLDRLPLKGDRVARSITLPAYISDVQKVVIWCAWAEANLGEAGFATALKLK